MNDRRKAPGRKPDMPRLIMRDFSNQDWSAPDIKREKLNIWWLLALIFEASVILWTFVGFTDARADDVCEIASGYAESSMLARQAGIKKETVVEVANDLVINENMKSLIKVYIDSSYTNPQFKTNEAKNYAVAEFKKIAYNQCVMLMADQGSVLEY